MNNDPNQNKPVQRKPAPQKPAPAAAVQNRPAAGGGAHRPAANANPNAAQAETRTIDLDGDVKIYRDPPKRGAAAAGSERRADPDGTYNLTGRDIKSSRQRVTESQKQRNQEDGMSVSANKSKIKDDEIEAKRGGFLMSGILKIIIYIVGVLLVSGFLAYNIVAVANDIFAFVKDDHSARVIIPAGADIEQIGQILYEQELIRYPKIFDLYMNFRRKDRAWEFEPGAYTVSALLNYDEFIWEFRKKAAEREVVRITVPEGYTIDQIIDIFVLENNIGTREKFEEVINTTDFSEYGYRFLKPLYETTLSPDRKYVLEGYMFPDTYEFYSDENETNIVMKFLNNFNVKFIENFYKAIEVLDREYMRVTGKGISIDDIISLASIIQWEALFMDDFPPISAVFHNRMLSPYFQRLESDATIQYTNTTMEYDEEREKYRYIKPTGEELRALLEIDAPYNTYRRDGLPPSAICNPGYEAIHAAVWPEENSPYYYFVANVNPNSPDYGKVYYGRNSDEHINNINKSRQ